MFFFPHLNGFHSTSECRWEKSAKSAPIAKKKPQLTINLTLNNAAKKLKISGNRGCQTVNGGHNALGAIKSI